MILVAVNRRALSKLKFAVFRSHVTDATLDSQLLPADCKPSSNFVVSIRSVKLALLTRFRS